MYADPQSVTIDTTPISLPRVSVGDRTAEYSNSDESVKLTTRHNTTKNGRVSRAVRLDIAKFASDPFISGNSRKVDSSYTLLINEPADASFTNEEHLANAKALLGWSSDANVTKLVAGES